MTPPKLITLKDYLMGRTKKYPISDDVMTNALVTVSRANQLLQAFGKHRDVNSGYRPYAINILIPNAKPKSKHITCCAIDFDDDDGTLDFFCLNNTDLLAEIGLWLEHPMSTPGWSHLQTLPPPSGRRVFLVN